jgi:hypothetical protein
MGGTFRTHGANEKCIKNVVGAMFHLLLDGRIILKWIVENDGDNRNAFRRAQIAGS